MYHFSITSISNELCYDIVGKSFSENIITHNGDVLGLCQHFTTGLDWRLDDGFDEYGTDYCQYVYYPDDNNTDCYLLAAWHEIDAMGNPVRNCETTKNN